MLQVEESTTQPVLDGHLLQARLVEFINRVDIRARQLGRTRDRLRRGSTLSGASRAISFTTRGMSNIRREMNPKRVEEILFAVPDLAVGNNVDECG